MPDDSPFCKEVAAATSLGDIVNIVGVEGYERLFVQQTEGTFEDASKWAIVRGLSEDQAGELDSFHFHARLTAVEMALKLGYALAITQRLGSFEEWLQAAITAAGLMDYKPDIRHFIFEDQESE